MRVLSLPWKNFQNGTALDLGILGCSVILSVELEKFEHDPES
jgi:hypothetical protein